MFKTTLRQPLASVRFPHPARITKIIGDSEIFVNDLKQPNLSRMLPLPLGTQNNTLRVSVLVARSPSNAPLTISGYYITGSRSPTPPIDLNDLEARKEEEGDDADDDEEASFALPDLALPDDETLDFSALHPVPFSAATLQDTVSFASEDAPIETGEEDGFSFVQQLEAIAAALADNSSPMPVTCETFSSSIFDWITQALLDISQRLPSQDMLNIRAIQAALNIAGSLWSIGDLEFTGKLTELEIQHLICQVVKYDVATTPLIKNALRTLALSLDSTSGCSQLLCKPDDLSQLIQLSTSSIPEIQQLACIILQKLDIYCRFQTLATIGTNTPNANQLFLELADIAATNSEESLTSLFISCAEHFKFLSTCALAFTRCQPADIASLVFAADCLWRRLCTRREGAALIFADPMATQNLLSVLRSFSVLIHSSRAHFVAKRIHRRQRTLMCLPQLLTGWLPSSRPSTRHHNFLLHFISFIVFRKSRIFICSFKQRLNSHQPRKGCLLPASITPTIFPHLDFMTLLWISLLDQVKTFRHQNQSICLIFF